MNYKIFEMGVSYDVMTIHKTCSDSFGYRRRSIISLNSSLKRTKRFVDSVIQKQVWPISLTTATWLPCVGTVHHSCYRRNKAKTIFFYEEYMFFSPQRNFKRSPSYHSFHWPDYAYKWLLSFTFTRPRSRIVGSRRVLSAHWWKNIVYRHHIPWIHPQTRRYYKSRSIYHSFLCDIWTRQQIGSIQQTNVSSCFPCHHIGSFFITALGRYSAENPVVIYYEGYGKDCKVRHHNNTK